MTPPDCDDRPPVSERVVAAVGREQDAPLTDLEPLYDTVDTEALDALFPGGTTANSGSVRQITFTYEGYEVCVDGDGTVDLSPAGTDRAREMGSPPSAAPSSATDAPD